MQKAVTIMYVSAGWVLLLIIFLSVKSSSQVSPVPDNSREYTSPQHTMGEDLYLVGRAHQYSSPHALADGGADHIFVAIKQLACG